MNKEKEVSVLTEGFTYGCILCVIAFFSISILVDLTEWVMTKTNIELGSTIIVMVMFIIMLYFIINRLLKLFNFFWYKRPFKNFGINKKCEVK